MFNITKVCRLCPSDVQDQKLINVFDTTVSLKNNIREVIHLTTGIEILESDLVSKLICQRCCKILLNWYDFRLDAIKQDRNLKEKFKQLLGDKGFRLPNSCITIKKQSVFTGVPKAEPKLEPIIEPCAVPPTIIDGLKKRFHPSVKDIYMNYPNVKIPSKCLDKNLTPIVSLAMGEVESYFKKRKLEMKKFIYRPGGPKLSSQKGTENKLTPKQKTVAPLKISKKLLANCNDSESSVDGGIIPSRKAKGKKRIVSKRLISSSESDENEDLPRKKQANIESITEAPKLDVVIPKIPEIPDHSIPSPVTSELNPRSPSPAPIDALSENSRDSCSTSISEATATSDSSTNKPEFLETFGSIPKVTTTKSHTLLVCNICGSVHNTGLEFKRHTKRHMVCPFCKSKFKSVDTKEDHVANKCQVKKMMNSSDPIVKLEKIHLNLEVREKYKSAFSTFKPIFGYEDVAPLEHIVIKAASPPPNVEANDIIVLSDDDEMSVTSHDPLSDYSAPSMHIPTENVYTTVSIVRPDIRIKNNTVLQSVAENMTDRKLIEDLLHLTKKQEPLTAEKMLQTDLPASKDLAVNHSDRTCIFKTLKGQLVTYKIPINVSNVDKNGTFDVSYQFKNNSKVNKSMALWYDLPVIDVARNPPQNHIASGSQGPSGNPPQNHIASGSQGPSRNPPQNHIASASQGPSGNPPQNHIASASQGPSGNPPQNHIASGSQGPSGSNSDLINIQLGSNASNYTLINNPANPIINVSNSATPLLQNYALSMPVPVVNNPIPIPRTFLNSALSNSAVLSNRNMSSGNGNSRVLPLYVTDGHNRSLLTSNLKNNNMSIRNSTGTPNRMVLPSGQYSSYSNSTNASSSPTVIVSMSNQTFSNPPGSVPAISSTVTSLNSSRLLYSNQSSANSLPSTTTITPLPSMTVPNLLPNPSANVPSISSTATPLNSSLLFYSNQSSANSLPSTTTITPIPTMMVPNLLPLNRTGTSAGSVNIISSQIISTPNPLYLVSSNQTSANNSSIKTLSSTSTITLNSLLPSHQTSTNTSSMNISPSTVSSNLPESSNLIPSNQTSKNSLPLTTSPSIMAAYSLAVSETSTTTPLTSETTSSTNVINVHLSSQLTTNASSTTSSSSCENATPSDNTVNPTPPREQVKFRVKNVWELQ